MPVQPDNWAQNGAFGVFGLYTFTFSHCLMVTVSVIIKRYLCGENALKVMIHYDLWVLFIIYEKVSELKPFNGSSTACDRTEHG